MSQNKLLLPSGRFPGASPQSRVKLLDKKPPGDDDCAFATAPGGRMTIMQQRVAVRTETTTEAESPELVVVVPTFNERDNIAPLLQKLAQTLEGIHWEVVFVDDDSTDGTVAALEQACRADRRVRSVRRLGRRGLASAVVEGIQTSFAPVHRGDGRRHAA